MDQTSWNFIFIGISFSIYIGIAIWSRAGSTKEYYTAGGSVSPFANGMATAADWMSAATFISMAGGIAADLQASRPAPLVPHPELSVIMDALAARITELEAKPLPVPPGEHLLDEGSYVCNLSTTCWHYTRSRPSWPAEYQRADCGWAFMYARHSRLLHMPSGQRQGKKFCKRCRPAFVGTVVDVLSDIE